MTEAALPGALAGRASRRSGGARGLFVRVAWRNLWRRRLRTWLSAGGLAFAIFLVSATVSLQGGSYRGWVDTATGLATGHFQVQHPDYFDDPAVRHVLSSGSALARQLGAVDGVVGVAPRAEAFVLVAAGERTFGALALGVDARSEAAMFDLPKRIVAGEFLPREDSAFVGTALAANLGIGLGAEIAGLGSTAEGGVAALVLTVDGIFETGQAELDRSMMLAPLAAVQAAFELGDGVHRLAVNAADASRVDGLQPALSAALSAALAAARPAEARLLSWRELLPEIEQGIRLDRISAQMIYWLLMVVVTMSVVNAFVMTVFERTREFGMLLAVGMRPNAIVGMLLVEATCVWVLGAAVGLVLALAVLLPLGVVGMPTTMGVEVMDEMATRLMMPDRLYPLVSLEAMTMAPLVMLAGTLLAALMPALRVRRMRPVDALREEE